MYATVIMICTFLVLPGHLAVMVCHRARGGVRAVEGLLVASLAGVLMTSVIAHTLGAVTRFTPRRLFLAWGLVCAVLALVALLRRAHPVPYSFRRTDGWFLIVFALLGVVYVPGVAWVFGSADEGIYLNTAAQLMREGRFWLQDDLTATLRGLGVARTNLYLPGYYFGGDHTVVPHGFHLYPSFLAGLWALVGEIGAANGPPIAMLLTVAAVFVLVTRLANAWVGLLVALVVGVNPISVWFSRITFAENFSAALLLGGFALLVAGWRAGEHERSRGFRVLCLAIAGSALGAVHLVKIEFLLLPPALIVFAAVSRARGPWDRAERAFFLSYLAVLGLAALHAITTHRVYFMAQIRDFLHVYSFAEKTGKPGWPEYAAAAAFLPLLALAAVVAFRCRGWCTRVWQGLSGETGSGRWVRLALAAASIVTTLILLDSGTRTGRTVGGITLYLTLPGALAASAGLWFVAFRRTLPIGPFFLFALLHTMFLCVLMHTTIDWGSNPHFMAYRRFVCISIPFLIVAAIVPWFYDPGGRGRTARVARFALPAIGTGLALWIGTQGLIHSWPHVGVRPWQNARQTVWWLGQRGGDDVVWIAPEADLTVTRLLTPLRMFEGQPSFVLSLWHNSPEAMHAVMDNVRKAGKRPLVICSHDWPWIPSARETLGEGIRSYIVEHVARPHPERLPDARDYYEWTYSVWLFGGAKPDALTAAKR